jgi:hypothetical protein
MFLQLCSKIGFQVEQTTCPKFQMTKPTMNTQLSGLGHGCSHTLITGPLQLYTSPITFRQGQSENLLNGVLHRLHIYPL